MSAWYKSEGEQKVLTINSLVAEAYLNPDPNSAGGR